MGLFASRPEEPTEWAGLPSEPLEPTAAEKIADTSISAATLPMLDGAGVESVAIPLPSTVVTPTDESPR